MGALEPASLKLRIPANADRASTLRRRLRAWLEEAGVSRDEAFEIVTAVSEAFINAVEHAQDPSSPQIEITAEVVDDHVTLAVRDHGSWRAEPRRTGGYGLLLMRTLMSAVEVHSATGATTVTMRRELRVPARSTPEA
ncbi:MAG TPA: ATP-binding protein [Gaiellaceae bacterium]|nr:ATP-binding protein [Gaiellaceae bacterium]